MNPHAQRLYAPKRVAVRASSGGSPISVAGIAVEAIREEWLVEDRWWTPEPLRRHYYELVLINGHLMTVFCSPGSGRWYQQRA
jgi:hypothetical protein